VCGPKSWNRPREQLNWSLSKPVVSEQRWWNSTAVYAQLHLVIKGEGMWVYWSRQKFRWSSPILTPWIAKMQSVLPEWTAAVEEISPLPHTSVSQQGTERKMYSFLDFSLHSRKTTLRQSEGWTLTNSRLSLVNI